MPFPHHKFRRLREQKGSREVFAELSGVDKRTLEALEQGRRPNPTQDTIEKLSAALGVDCRFFFTPDETGDDPPAEPAAPAAKKPAAKGKTK
jgi:transcriptional regulator with XRE-family HTH domain